VSSRGREFRVLAMYAMWERDVCQTRRTNFRQELVSIVGSAQGHLQKSMYFMRSYNSTVNQTLMNLMCRGLLIIQN
jgi:hypothetical protein